MIIKFKLHQFIVIAIICLIAANCYSQYETFSQTYDLLTTLAGKGEIDNKGDNGWLQEYEGGLASEAELSRPHIAMADSAGNIYIADKDAHAIRKVDTEGVITTVAGISTAGNGGEGIANELALNAPNGLWVNKYGDFYILDLNNDKIRKVDREGNMTTLIDDVAGISLGRGLWVSKSEDTVWYSSGSQIKMWTEASGIVTYASGFSGLGNITQDRSGNIVATDRTANRVYRIDMQGNKLTIAGNGSAIGGGDGSPALETALDGVRGVWFLEDNTYFLATHEGSQVWYIDSEGIAHLFLNGLEGDEYYSGDGENYQTPGYKISEARAVTVDYQGNVLITENDRGFIRQIEKIEVDALINYLVPDKISVYAFPNPSTDLIRLRYTLPNPAEVKISIFNQEGQLVEILLNEMVGAGTHELAWNNTIPAGIYYVSLQSDGLLVARKLIIGK